MDEKELKENIIREEETIEEKKYINDVGEKIIERTIKKIIYIKDNTKIKDSQRKYYENIDIKYSNIIYPLSIIFSTALVYGIEIVFKKFALELLSLTLFAFDGASTFFFKHA